MSKIAIKDLGFDEKMMEIINGTEEIFKEIAKEEGTNETLESWINGNLKECEDNEDFEGLTEREKFLYSLGIINGIITERYM